MDVSRADVVAIEAAFHEAGHLVGAVLRGGRLASGVEGTGSASGSSAAERECRLAGIPEQVRPFVAYAGVWAVARHRWMLQGTVGEDALGRTFDDYVATAMLGLPDDAMCVAMAEYDISGILRHGGADDDACWRWIRGVHHAWRGELEDVWDVVDVVATHQLRGYRPDGREIARMTDERLASLYA